MPSIWSSQKFQICFLVLIALLVFLGRPNGVTLRNNDDAYYAQKAKEMRAADNPMIVTYNGTPSFDNTPLPFWLMAANYKLLGVSAFSSVLHSGLLGASTVWLTYLLALRLFNDRWTAFISAAILIFPGFYADYARRAMVDVTLTFFFVAALYSFHRGLDRPRWHLLFGLFTAMAILTKSVLGVFPLMIAPLFLIFTGRWKAIVNGWFLSGMLVALGLGGSWYAVNWLKFGDPFLETHFGWLILHRGLTGSDGLPIGNGDPFFFLGYLKDLLKNYWPWVPITFAGLALFLSDAIKNKSQQSIFLLVWIGVVLAVMSSSRTQTLRYVLSIFPALAMMNARTLSGWFSLAQKKKVLIGMAGVLIVAAGFINLTSIEVKQSASLKENNPEIRGLASAIHLNTPAGGAVGNYRLSNWNPRNVVYFYADRYVAAPIADERQLEEAMRRNPETAWLTPTDEFFNLDKQLPVYLIQSEGKYAYFTSRANKENVRRHAPGDKLLDVPR